jgi:predicted TIM-barrel fold metal-dependent hydrolase
VPSDYRLVDADHHYYETDDCFLRHMPAAFKDRAVNIRRGTDGLGKIYIGDQRLAFMSVTPMDYVQPPGSLRPYLEGKVERDAIADARMECPPPFQDRHARLRLMDEQSVEAMVLFPTLGVVVEHELHDDADLLHAHLNAFNRWLEDDWGYAFEERIFAAPLLSLLDLSQALAELDRVLAAGARLVHLKSGPVYGRSPGDPVFDPFWARVAEAGVPVAFHAGDAGYNELVSAPWGEPARIPSRKMSAFQVYLSHNRPIMDTLAALVLHGLFTRFPTLQVMSIEQGSEWVPAFLGDLDKAFKFNPYGSQGHGPSELPSEVFKQHVYVAPFHEEDIATLVATIGAERVLFGSDFPHPEGVAEPLDFADLVNGFQPDASRRILRDNTAALLRLS